MFELTETGGIQKDDKVLLKQNSTSIAVKVIRDGNTLFLNKDGEKEITISFTLYNLIELFFNTLLGMDFETDSDIEKKGDWVTYKIRKAVSQPKTKI